MMELANPNVIQFANNVTLILNVLDANQICNHHRHAVININFKEALNANVLINKKI